ncbi:hypothetical protein [Streptomyces hokutonensis]|uniref:hypothetical protein n=1 Tax=Streptomyces hokutonensis TaxID=1306990 RepID=UPI00036271C7|nr:hypothetical protein [Streptomyces hokutonensis]
MNVIAELRVPPLYRGDRQAACPVCGQFDELTLIIDSEDASETPAFMRCDDGHQWAEPAVPRRIGAGLFALRLRDHPELIDWSAVQDG